MLTNVKFHEFACFFYVCQMIGNWLFFRKHPSYSDHYAWANGMDSDQLWGLYCLPVSKSFIKQSLFGNRFVQIQRWKCQFLKYVEKGYRVRIPGVITFFTRGKALYNPDVPFCLFHDHFDWQVVSLYRQRVRLGWLQIWCTCSENNVEYIQIILFCCVIHQDICILLSERVHQSFFPENVLWVIGSLLNVSLWGLKILERAKYFITVDKYVSPCNMWRGLYVPSYPWFTDWGCFPILGLDILG